ncbi:FkbM family methyltransferase [Leptolyngbya sp. FACHB-261]|uniref:FkbM family methyltransferase n=1 Tax=Leptolyngbya sp. FACHB-261 TaxID=2692806 RepID=UPI00168913A2|nr:FkbM family methyltransferase [Leptolyngbya sp. FACHB-261]MBD2103189.1 FkbM family methyltransferase [Leptolyngbya sp. FACHB-261]
MIIVDIGAKDGQAFSIPFAQDDSSNIVYATEPISELAEQLRSHQLPNLNVFCLAVGDGEQAFDSKFSHPDSAKTPIIRLDTLLEKNAIVEIDFFRIDGRTHDALQVLNSAGEYVHCIKKIFIEAQTVSSAESRKGKEQVIEILTNRGFRLIHTASYSAGSEENLEFDRISRYSINNQQAEHFAVEVPHVGLLQMPKNDHVGQLLEEGTFEGAEQAFLWLYLRPGDTFFDCGAHAGLFSCLAAKRLGNSGRIVGFDPNPLCFSLYEQNLTELGYESFTAFNLGLAETGGYSNLLLGKPGMSAFSTFAEGAKSSPTVGDEVFRVEQTSLDDVIRNLDIDKVDFVKLDVEGWESFVLKGASQSIRAGKLPLWMIEFTEANAAVAGSSTRELYSLVEGFGYTLCRFDATRLRVVPEVQKQQYPYDNLFAVADIEAVNQRLATAEAEFLDKAKDIIAKWDTAVRGTRWCFTALQERQTAQTLRQRAEEAETTLVEQQAAQQTAQQAAQQAAQKAAQELEQRVQALEASLATAEQTTTHLQQVNDRLRDDFREAELTRARLNNELYHHNLFLKQKADQLWQTRNHFLQANSDLQREVESLATGRAALRTLIKVLLKKLRVYDFAYSNYGVFVPVYNALFRDRWRPATIPQAVVEADTQGALVPTSSPQASSSQPDLRTVGVNSPTAEVFVTLRNFAEDASLQAIETFQDFLAGVSNALCIYPAKATKQLLPLLSDLEVKTTCVSSKEQKVEISASSHLDLVELELGEYLAKTNKLDFHTLDLLILDAQAPPEVFKLLKGRLSPNTKVLFSGASSNDRLSQLNWGPAWAEIGNLSLYKAPDLTWVDPLWQESQRNEHLQWPWNYRLPRVAATMPSGKPWPKISIVTVTLNQGDYLEETIRSVLLQGYPNLEYIVLDGGSSDNTLEILERYSSELTYWTSEPDKGQSNALNKGFSRATGEILAWLNSDDRYLPGTLFRVALAFENYGSDMVAGGCSLVKGNAQKPFHTHHNAMPIGKVVPLPLERLLDIDGCWQKGEFFYQPEVFWTKELWERSGAGLDESLFYSMDYELWVRMAYQEAKIVHLPDALTLFRVHEKQKTYGDNIPFLPELRKVNATFREKI